MPANVPKPLLLAIAALLVVIWGTTWRVIRIGLEGIPPLTGVALRFAIAGVFLLLLARLRNVPLGRQRGERMLWMVNALFSFCLSYGVVYWGEQWVPSGLASVLFATYPVFVALLAHFLLAGERLAPRVIAGTALAFGGTALIFSEDFALLGGRQVLLASGVMLLSPIAAAIGTVAVKHWGRGIHPISLTAMPMAITGAVMGLLAIAFEGHRAVRFDATSVGALLYLALVGSALTFSLYFWLLARVTATRVAMIAYCIPIVAVTIGILTGEPFTLRIAAGAGTILAGVALAVHVPARRRPGV